MPTVPGRKISTVTKPDIVLPERKESMSVDNLNDSNNSNSSKNNNNNSTSELESKLENLNIGSIPESTAMWVMGATPFKDNRQLDTVNEKPKPKSAGIFNL